MKIALTAVEDAAYHFDRLYSYAVPDILAREARPGARVTVPFGRGNRLSRGVIYELAEGEGAGVKPISELLDPEPVVPPEMLELALWLKAQTFCTLYEAVRPSLPPGMGVKVEEMFSLNRELPPDAFCLLSGDEKILCDLLQKRPMERSKLLARAGLPQTSGLPEQLARQGFLVVEDVARKSGGGAFIGMARAVPEEDEARALLESAELTRKQKAALRVLLDAGSAAVREICYFAGVTPAVVNALVKKGVVELYEQRVMRTPDRGRTLPQEEPALLSPAQRAAYEELFGLYARQQPACALLYGVTGSGKTQVFMKLIERARADGRGVIVLVPEISLTPQAVERFYARFGEDVAVLHSGLSIGERQDEWQRLRDGRARIAVGTRSAVFAPVHNLGLIILDEEQEHTYKSESSPRYHARDVARFRCAKSGGLLVLASATPSVESFHAALAGRYTLVRLDERFGGAVLPEVVTVDVKQELAGGRDSPVSARLLEELRGNLARGEQSILLLNRRGYSTFVYCADCGHVLSCPNCSIALTYHAANGRLMCHYCGYSARAAEQCPACGSRHVRYSGQGTQKAEETLAGLLPGARILRMDTDTTSSRQAHTKLLRAFDEGQYDILIGTQMVAKGLDFPRVTLVGVLSADQTLYSGDFRAGERTFSLLTQVVGRSGRGSLRGRAVIQTGTPENEVIRLACAQDYDAFCEAELRLRRELLYPPFCDLCVIGFSAPEEKIVKPAAEAFFNRLKEEILKRPGMPARVIGPSPATVYRAGGRYRYKILLKCRGDRETRAMLARLLQEQGRRREFSGCAVYADMNALSVP